MLSIKLLGGRQLLCWVDALLLDIGLRFESEWITLLDHKVSRWLSLTARFLVGRHKVLVTVISQFKFRIICHLRTLLNSK